MQSDWTNNDNDWKLKKLQHDSLKTAEKVVDVLREAILMEVLAQGKDYERLFGSHSAQFAEYLTMVAQKLEQHGVRHSDVINWLNSAANEGAAPSDFANDLRDSQSKTVPFIDGGPMHDFGEQSLLDKSLGTQGAASPRPSSASISQPFAANSATAQAVTSPYQAWGAGASSGNGHGGGQGNSHGYGQGSGQTPSQPVAIPPHTPVSMPLQQPPMPMQQPMAMPMPMQQQVAMPMPMQQQVAMPMPVQQQLAMPMPTQQPMTMPMPMQQPMAAPVSVPQTAPAYQQAALPPHTPMPSSQSLPQPNFNRPAAFNQSAPTPFPAPAAPPPSPPNSPASINQFAPTPAPRREEKKDEDKYVYDPNTAWD